MSADRLRYSTHYTVTHFSETELTLQETIVTSSNETHSFLVSRGGPKRVSERLEKVVGDKYLKGEVSIGRVDLVHLAKVRDALAGVQSIIPDPEPYFRPPAEE